MAILNENTIKKFIFHYKRPILKNIRFFRIHNICFRGNIKYNFIIRERELIRRVRFPLKLKLNLIIAGLIIFSITLYITFALDLFKKDKSAYIYETILLNSGNLAGQLKSELRNIHQTLNLLADTYESNKKNTNNIFKSYPSIITFSIFQEQNNFSKRIFHLLDSSTLQSNGLPSNHFTLAEKINPIPFDILKSNSIYIGDPTMSKEISHFLIGIYRPEKKRYYTARFTLTDILKMLSENRTYHSYVINDQGKIFINKNFSKKINNEFIKNITSGNRKKGVKELKKNNESVLTAFTHINEYNLYVISEISKKTAFQAAQYLINQSIYFGVFVLFISILTGLFFAKTQTTPIDKLFKATKKIAEGDFSFKVAIKSQDEIGSLSDSFNYMSQKIITYTEEMKKKAVMENELAVAKLVQNSFFPDNNLKLPFVDISSFYTPANECGGDWWGYIKNDEKIILIIADATGHGVSSAFMTATASCCAHNLELMQNKDILESPAKILSFMNYAVCKMAENILMTCFVGILNPQKMTIKYSNASHNHPLIYKPKKHSPKKEDFFPLLDARGPRLGHKINATFGEKEISIHNKSTLILFTDGVTECVNNSGKQWGERKFLKSLIGNMDKDIELVRDGLIDDIKNYAQDKTFEDDITLVISRILV
ncbi:MAG: SpoIIE family protein phosphatase [Halobacteriovoraceae bacterium]|nr:SpoIIE family protein phosphatase [Halobacteriovoraceae bacterium]